MVQALAVVSFASVLVGCAAGGAPAEGDKSPITFGVSGPLTGQNAQYGKDWNMGFDLFLEEINAAGGIDGRKVVIDFQDSQNDPSQATTIAQRFISDDKINAVIGDFSSSTSTVASPLYQRAGLLQLGITNSAPDFTKTGDFIFSPAVTSNVEARVTENFAAGYGDKIAVVYINTDFGKSFADIFADEAKKRGQEIVLSTGVEETSTDFKPVLLQVNDAKPDVVVFLTYYKTTALLVQQAQQVGLNQTIVVMGANYSAEYLELASAAAEGTVLITPFYKDDDRTEVRDFVTAFEKKFKSSPNQFSAFAYDGLQQLVWAYKNSDGTREGIRNALRDGSDIPSVVFGPFSYGDDRRIDLSTLTALVVKNGEFAKVDG